MRPFLLFLTIILLFCLALPSSADNQARPFSLTISAGLFANTEFGRLQPLPNTADVPEIVVSLENKGLSAGMALGYLIGDRFDLRASIMFNRSAIMNDIGPGLTGIPLGKTKVSDTKSCSYSGNVIIYISRNPTSPFVKLGLGAVRLNPAQLRPKTKFFLNFGTGFKFKLTRHLSTFLEIQDMITFFDYPRDFGVFFPAIYTPEFKKSQHRLGFHVYLSYSL